MTVPAAITLALLAEFILMQTGLAHFRAAAPVVDRPAMITRKWLDPDAARANLNIL